MQTRARNSSELPKQPGENFRITSVLEGVKHMFASDGGQNGAKHACFPNGLLLYKQRCCLYKKCKFCQFIDLLTVTATTVWWCITIGRSVL